MTKANTFAPPPHLLRLQALAIEELNKFPGVLRDTEITAEQVLDVAVSAEDTAWVIENPSLAIERRADWTEWLSNGDYRPRSLRWLFL